MQKKKVAIMALLLPLLLLAESGPAQGPAEFPTLGKDPEPLRSDFNRDAGAVRLLLLLDPT